ncbi:MAG: transposase [Syntrophobacterales bacterium]|nr:transposase [Syntrophobacterales bacterium]
MPRIARVTLPGYPHHVTQRGNNREDVFFDDKDRGFYKSTLKRYCESCKVDILSYCLMSNHVHLLAVPLEESALACCVGRTNLLYTQYVNRKYHRSGRLWQNRFYSAIVDDDVYLWAVMRYIELNPVKAGIVKDPVAYPWSSCRATVEGIGDELITSSLRFDANDRAAYGDFVMQYDSVMDENIRRATSTGRPLGSVDFVEGLEKLLSRKLLGAKVGRPKKK